MAISDLDYADDSDVALIRRTRTGDTDAYGILHTRHVGSARALAWRMSRSASDADDLVSEGFARVLRALQGGNGPEVAFRPYLLSTIRRLAYDRTDRERREVPVAHDLDQAPGPDDDPVLAGFERGAAAAAFATLPERWRLVLWHTEVEGQKPAEVAQLLGIKPNAVAALAYRAREGLRQAYLAHHAPAPTAADRACRRTTDRLAAYVRGSLATGQAEQVRRHLDDCDRCRAAHLELAQLNTSLRGLVAFAVLGPVAGTYLAHGATPVVGAATPGAATSGARPPSATPATATAARRPVRATVVATVVGLAALAGWFASRPAPVPVDLAGASEAEAGPAASGTGGPPAERRQPTAVEGATETSSSTPADGPLDPTPPAPPTTAVRPVPPASPVPGRPGPRDGAPPSPTTPTPPPTVPPSTVPPTVVPTTTAPPVTTTVPPPPAVLDVDLTSAGKLVDGRDGTVVATVANTGAGEAGPVTVDLDLAPLAPRGLPDQPGWACAGTGPGTLRCRTSGLAPGAVRALYVPITAPGWSGAVAAQASATGPGAVPSPPRDLDLVVEPTGMSARVATVDHGDVLVTGSSLLTCPLVVAADACDLGRRGIATGGKSLNNNGHAMVPVDVDGDPATTTSSAAALVLPPGAQVLSATLYAGADTSAGVGGSGVADPEGARGRAVLTAPDGTASAVVADRVDAIGTRFQAVADVTASVRAGGSGTWTVGGVAVGTGADRYAGWTLVVVVRQPDAPLRSLVVLDGLSQVELGGGPVTLGVGGFVVPPGGATRATLTVAAYEGDLGTSGDALSLVSGGRTAPAGGLADDNVFDSSAPGPGDRNRFGYDLDRFEVQDQLAPGTTAADIVLTTSGDTYLPGLVTFAVDQ